MKPTVAFIFARGGSKGIPRKNLQLLAGKTLLAHSIAVALRCPSIDRCIVSTDDAEIADEARRSGAEVPMLRPAALAADETPEALAWKHAVQELAPGLGTFVSLPTTSPFRAVEDIERCLERFRRTQPDLVITCKQTDRNPYYNMVRVDDDGWARIAAGETLADRRQAAPSVRDMTTVGYVASPEFVLRHQHLFEGRTQGVEVPVIRGLDIDSPFDLLFAEFLAQVQPKPDGLLFPDYE